MLSHLMTFVVLIFFSSSSGGSRQKTEKKMYTTQQLGYCPSPGASEPEINLSPNN